MVSDNFFRGAKVIQRCKRTRKLITFRSDFSKHEIYSKSFTKKLYGNTFLVSECIFKSSDINEVIEEVISSLFYKEILHKKKQHKMQTSDFYSDIFLRLKSIKSKQATFTHKKHKTSSKLRFRCF